MVKCTGYCGTMCGYNKECCKVGPSFVNHHHHHSHFDRYECLILTYTIFTAMFATLEQVFLVTIEDMMCLGRAKHWMGCSSIIGSVIHIYSDCYLFL